MSSPTPSSYYQRNKERLKAASAARWAARSPEKKARDAALHRTWTERHRPPKVDRSPLALPELPAGFGDWLAGFIDGEGCFVISRQLGTRHSCVFRLKLRADDAAVLWEIQGRTGLGRVTLAAARGSSRAQALWSVRDKRECAVLVAILDRHPLRAKKRRDFEIWREAVAVWLGVRTAGVVGRRWERVSHDAAWARMAEMKEQLEAVRRFV